MFKIITKNKYQTMQKENEILSNLAKKKTEQLSELKVMITEQLVDLEKLEGKNAVLDKEYERVNNILESIQAEYKSLAIKLIALNHLAECNKNTIQRLTEENEKLHQLSPTVSSILEHMDKYKQIAINNRMMLDHKYYGNQLGRFAIYNQYDVYDKWHTDKLAELDN